jgi:LPXTG-motif cell wall-anchored protein
LFSILLSPASVSAAEIGQGTIEGQVINDTENGGSVDSQEVILTTYLGEEEMETESTTTASDGFFRFLEISTEPGLSYDVEVLYQEVEYRSERLVFDDDNLIKSIELIVYDTTENPEVIEMELAHIIIYVESDILQVEEYLLFINESDKTYVGMISSNDESIRESLKFTIPKGAAELKAGYGLMDCCIIITENGFIDTMPVLPGPKEVVYSYQIYPDSKEYVFSKDADYPVRNLTLLIQGENIDISSEQLFADEPLSIEGVTFNHLTGNNIARGEQLSVQLSELPVTGSSINIVWLALILAILIGGFLFVFTLRRRKLVVEVPPESKEKAYQEVLTELAQLDDDFEDGKIDKEVYRRLRDEKKSQLLQSAKSIKGNAGNQ